MSDAAWIAVLFVSAIAIAETAGFFFSPYNDHHYLTAILAVQGVLSEVVVLT